MKKIVKLLTIVCALGAMTFATQSTQAQQVERPKNLDVQQLKQAKVLPQSAVKVNAPLARTQKVVKRTTPTKKQAVQAKYKRQLMGQKIQDTRKARLIKD